MVMLGGELLRRLRRSCGGGVGRGIVVVVAVAAVVVKEL